jgi:hypothetical protein
MKMSENLASVLLGVVGVGLSLLFSYVPGAKAWLSTFQNKGAVMLTIVAGVAAVYFGVACTPFAGQFNITLACSQDSVFELLKALFIIASGNQLTYLYTKTEDKPLG